MLASGGGLRTLSAGLNSAASGFVESAILRVSESFLFFIRVSESFRCRVVFVFSPPNESNASNDSLPNGSELLERRFFFVFPVTRGVLSAFGFIFTERMSRSFELSVVIVMRSFESLRLSLREGDLFRRVSRSRSREGE